MALGGNRLSSSYKRSSAGALGCAGRASCGPQRRRVDLERKRLATLQQDVEGFGVVQEQGVLNHALVVLSQRLPRVAAGCQIQCAGDSCAVVDRFSVRSRLGEEDAPVLGHGVSQRAVLRGAISEASGIETRDVVPVAREACAAAEAALGTEDMDGRGLLPERALGAHDLGCGRRKPARFARKSSTWHVQGAARQASAPKALALPLRGSWRGTCRS